MTLTVHRGELYEYRDETDRGYFSVTQVRKEAYDSFLGIDPAVLESARRRGELLHRRFFFVVAAVAGVTAYPPVIPSLQGYCESMDRWASASRIKAVVGLEQQVLNKRYGYAGTLDAHVLERNEDRNRPVNAQDKPAIYDLKSGEPTITDAMQLVAYAHGEGMPLHARLVDIYLHADGKQADEVEVSAQDRPIEWAAFINALSLMNWRRRHGK